MLNKKMLWPKFYEDYTLPVHMTPPYTHTHMHRHTALGSGQATKQFGRKAKKVISEGQM